MQRIIAKGFTLIELMIVITMIGILSAIAIPAYSDFVGRAQVAEAFSLMSGQKAAVVDYYSTYGECPTNGKGNIPSPSQLSGKYVDRIVVGNSAAEPIQAGNTTVESKCVIMAYMKTTGIASGRIRGQTLPLLMAPTSGAFVWRCGVSGIPDKYLPQTCIDGNFPEGSG